MMVHLSGPSNLSTFPTCVSRHIYLSSAIGSCFLPEKVTSIPSLCIPRIQSLPPSRFVGCRCSRMITITRWKVGALSSHRAADCSCAMEMLKYIAASIGRSLFMFIGSVGKYLGDSGQPKEDGRRPMAPGRPSGTPDHLRNSFQTC